MGIGLIEQGTMAALQSLQTQHGLVRGGRGETRPAGFLRGFLFSSH
jgi:hypothetical protein